MNHWAPACKPLFWALVFLLPCTSSCLTDNRKVDLPLDLAKGFSSSGKASIPPQWWTVFGDENLNRLTDQALGKNFTLKAAWSRLDRARALVRLGRAPLYPTLNASGGLARTMRATESNVNTDYTTTYSLRLSAGYEVDLWGKLRATADGARLALEATHQDVKASALSVSGLVTSTWYQLVERRAQLKLLNNQVQTNNQYLGIVQFRFRKGEVTAVDVLQQQELLESTKTDRVRVRADIDVLQHRLAILVGEVPGRFKVPLREALPTLPPLPQTGVPAKWLQSRPDIHAAYLRVRSLDRDIATAIADQYPTFTLSADIQTIVTDPANLFKAWLVDLAGDLVAPLFDGGRRKAEVDRSKGAAGEALHNYGQAVLTGIGEVEDALTNEKHQIEVVQGLERQLKLSQSAVQQLVNKYRNGNVNFLRVLDELRRYQQLERAVILAQGQLVQFRIDLYRALGQSWRVKRPRGVDYPLESSNLVEPPVPQ